MSLPPPYTLQTGPWEALQVFARPVREQVFLTEQGIDPSLEWDADDLTALHAVVQCDGQPVATARLLASAHGTARIGRMSVLRAHRGQGLGRALLDTLVAQALQRGDGQVLLHAQCHARRFYEAAGFIAHNAVFFEAGIAHVEMVKPLPA